MMICPDRLSTQANGSCHQRTAVVQAQVSVDCVGQAAKDWEGNRWNGRHQVVQVHNTYSSFDERVINYGKKLFLVIVALSLPELQHSPRYAHTRARYLYYYITTKQHVHYMNKWMNQTQGPQAKNTKADRASFACAQILAVILAIL